METNDLIKKWREKFMSSFDELSGTVFDDLKRDFGSIKTQKTEINKIQIKFTNKSTNPNPSYATSGSAGMDLRANLSEDLIIPPHKVSIVPTGLYFELPPNMEIQVRPRSGLAAKNFVTVLNTPGTIDSDYRGEIKVILINHGEEDFVIHHGDRIAQAVVATAMGSNIIALEQVDEINDDTHRSSGGFGSTGVK